jgi:hypothetical protein
VAEDIRRVILGAAVLVGGHILCDLEVAWVQDFFDLFGTGGSRSR